MHTLHVVVLSCGFLKWAETVVFIMIGVNSELIIFHERFRGYSTLYPDTYVYHYVYFCNVQLSADTSFSVLME